MVITIVKRIVYFRAICIHHNNHSKIFRILLQLVNMMFFIAILVQRIAKNKVTYQSIT